MSAAEPRGTAEMDWNAGRYHVLSEPQLEWGREVMPRLLPRRGERILDLGCGTGRLTTELLERMGAGVVVGLDRSAPMLVEARRVTDPTPGLAFVRGDGAALPFAEAFDAVFSTAALHWMLDHAAVFDSVYCALVAGGRFVAQCGGRDNLRTLYGRAAALLATDPFAAYAGAWRQPWLFADVATTRARLERAGFTAVEVWLEPRNTTLPDRATYAEFIELICLRSHVALLPGSARAAFIDALAQQSAADPEPFTLDYWRLNLAARKPLPAAAPA